MITAIEIENLRGIRHGKLEGLGKLTILTGPNACGKSTVLDALLIGCSPDPADAVGRAVARHGVPGGGRWLVRGGARKAQVKIWSDTTSPWELTLTWSEVTKPANYEELAEAGVAPPYSVVSIVGRQSASDGDPDRQALASSTVVGFGGQFVSLPLEGLSPSPAFLVRLVDPGQGAPNRIDETFSEVARTGDRESIYQLLKDLVPGFERLEILSLGQNDFSLHVTSAGRSVPLALSGDGIQAFVQLALEIAVAPEGLVLVEEPEVYQHPKAIRQSAKALLANMRRGVQMVITTHSLELIDALLAEAQGEDLDGLVLFNLLLENSELKSGRRAGEEISFARETLEKDLR